MHFSQYRYSAIGGSYEKASYYIKHSGLPRRRMSDLATLGFIVIVVGVFTIVLGTLFFGSRSPRDRADEEGGEDKDEDGRKKTEVRGGGVIFIGPIPIIFGTDIRWTIAAMVLALVLLILGLFLTGIW
jgi:uncharacterized protein (TIGR00304 family)